MLMSGLIILAFIIYHLLHFTVQVQYINLTGQNFVDLHGPGKAARHFQNDGGGVQQPLGLGFYILGMALLCLHLSHGVSSMFQSLGWKNKAYGPLLDKGSRGGRGADFSRLHLHSGCDSAAVIGKEALK